MALIFTREFAIQKNTVAAKAASYGSLLLLVCQLHKEILFFAIAHCVFATVIFLGLVTIPPSCASASTKFKVHSGQNAIKNLQKVWRQNNFWAQNL